MKAHACFHVLLQLVLTFDPTGKGSIKSGIGQGRNMGTQIHCPEDNVILADLLHWKSSVILLY